MEEESIDRQPKSTRGAATRERIVREAFALFAEHGFHAVSVRDIAAAVGVKDASLYNHFPTKQAIFDAVLADQLARTQAAFAEEGVMFEPSEDPAGYAGAYDETERRVLAGFRYFFEDEQMIQLRCLLLISQFDDARALAAFREIFLDRPREIQAAVFAHLMENGRFREDDPRALALAFYGPVFLLMMSSMPWAEAEPLVRDHMRRFYVEHAIEGGERV